MEDHSAGRAVPGFTRALVVGAIVSVTLLVAVLVIGAIQSHRAEVVTLALARRSQRSSFLLGDVAEQLARLRSQVTSALHRPPEALGPFERRIDAIQGVMSRAVRDLPESLHPEERVLWSRLRPQVERLERDLLGAFVLVRAGDHDAAAKLLETDIDDSASAHELLDELADANEARLLEELERARRSAAQVILIELATGGLLVLSMLAIWLTVLRTIRSQAQLLEEYIARVETAKDDLDAFAGRVAHDLKNALTPLGMNVQVLRRSGSSPENVRLAAERIERCSAKAVGIIEGLLAFSRAGVAAEVDESTSVERVVKGVLEELEPLVSQVGAVVETAVEQELQARCAEGLLHQLIANLCNNAVKFLQGRGERKVRLSARAEGTWCVLEVADTGPGIPKDARARIFDPFYRVPGASAPGMGIGLATVRRIVDAYGGTVVVDSVEDQGTRFTVRLPLGVGGPRRSPQGPALPEAPAQPPP